MQIILITLFNACDLTGRTLPRYVRVSLHLHACQELGITCVCSARWDSFIVLNEKTVTWVNAARIIWIPLFILSLHPKVFVSDVWMYCFMIGMGLTNGYCSTLLMMFGPDRVVGLRHSRRSSPCVRVPVSDSVPVSYFCRFVRTTGRF